MQRPGIWARAVHPGGTDQWFLPDDTDGNQDHQLGFLLQKDGIQRGVPADEHNGSGQRARGSVPGCPGPTPGLECRVDALPWDERVKLRGHRQRKTDPNH